MSNAATPPSWQRFPPPYRMTVVADRLIAALQSKGCTVTIEPFVIANDGNSFPNSQHDTCRVFVRRDGVDVNVHGIIEKDIYFYRAMTYGKPPGPHGYDAPMGRLDEIIDYVVSQF